MIAHRVVLALVAVSSCSSIWADGSVVDFASQIEPIFQQHCIRCHEPGNEKGDVSLATADDLVSNEYVVAGEPESSHLIELVTAHDGELPAMPKQASHLSQGDIAILRRWIKQGADWPSEIVIREKSKADASWWSLQPLSVDFRSVISEKLDDTVSQLDLDADAAVKVNIDDFIRAKLDEHQLTPSHQADRRTLIRRLSFDLHGLPPTPEAIEAFVNDTDPLAYKKLVDQLLESPHYGERFAQHWLDVAHYADTHGFERDMRRDNAWRYRDYVIRSLNEDIPYDRFLQEQIAGDVLWPDDEQALIATGFLAAGPWDFVGQVETKSPELRRAARSLDLDDMLTQVMTATMAITINCARCHNHKLDPISQQEYYQLQAVFAGVRRDDRVVSDVLQSKYEETKTLLTSKRNEIDFKISRLEGTGLNLSDIVGGGDGVGTGTYRSAIDPRSAQVQARDFGKLGNVVTNKFSPSAFEFVDGVFIPDGQDGTSQIPISSTGLAITGLPKTSGDAWDMIRNGPVASQHSTELGGIDFIKDGHSLLGLHANAGITFDVAAMRNHMNGDQVSLRFTAKLGYFGAVGGYDAEAWVYVDGQRIAHFPHLKRDAGLQNLDIELPPSSRFLTLVATDGGNGFSMDQIGFGDPIIRLSEPAELTSSDQTQLAELRLQRLDVIAKIDSLGPPPRFYGVVAESVVPEVRVLTRGDPESPTGDALGPTALGALAMLDQELGTIESPAGERRAALASWITRPDNPLTPRVIVNRLWHWHFGVGLVDTPSDFGFGGGQPSHPKLLDWLAGELVRNKWSLKALHRLIVNSEAYQQTSYRNDETENQAARQIDSDNRLLWRQNPRRIEAESIRDAVLSVSGKLNLARGGPGFEDFQYQEAYAPIYTYITADKPALWRRSVYRFIVRTTPNAFLTTLDCPDPANLTPKRMTTTTPLQSLALYNNNFMLHQAQYFTEHIEQEVGSDMQLQIIRAFKLAIGRRPTDDESQLAGDFVHRQGLFALCRSIFSSNEFVYVD